MEDKLKKIEEKVKETAGGLKKIEKNIRAISSLLKDPENVYRIEQLIISLEGLIQNTEFDRTTLLKVLRELKDESDKLKEDFRFEFSKRLEQGLRDIGKELKGQLPDLYTGFYRLKIDFIGGKADLLFGAEKITKCLLSPDEIIKRLIKLEQDIEKNSIPEEEFIKRLYSAWTRASAILNREKIPLTTILTELVVLVQKRQFYENPLRGNYTEYPRYQFAYDIYRLQKKGARKTEGKDLQLVASTFDATRKKIDYIWIPTNERGDGVNYSYLFFR